MRFDPSDSFPHYHEKYLCSCFGAHCKAATIRLGLFTIICVGISILGHFYLHLQWDVAEIAAIAVTMVAFIITLLLFIGIRWKNYHLIAPFVLLQIAWMLSSVSSMMVMFICLIRPDSVVARHFKKHPGFVVKKWEQLRIDAEFRGDCAFRFFCSFVALLFCFWFYTISRQCYVYLRDYSRHQRKEESPDVMQIVKCVAL